MKSRHLSLLMPEPYPDQEMIDKVKAYHKKGLSFREIAKLLEKDLKNVYRWYQYGVGEIKPGKPGRPKKGA
jgi:transposase